MATATQVKWALTGDEIWVSSPYKPEFVDALKVAVAHSDRRWIPTRKVWAVHFSCKGIIHRLVREYYGVELGEPENRTAEHEAKKESAEIERMRKEIIRLTRERDDALLTTHQMDRMRTVQRENLRQIIQLQQENARLAREVTSARLNAQFSGFGRSRNAGDGLSLRELFEGDNGKSVYKRVMMAMHPDNGGDAETAKKITALWDEVNRGK
jgi:hypothetical protein